MSKQQRQTLVARVGSYVTQFRSYPMFSLGGVPCSELNREIIARCLEAWLFLNEDLMLRLELGAASRKSRMDNFVQTFLTTDFVKVLSLLEEIYACLIEDRYIQRIDDFKHHLDAISSGQCSWQGLLSPVNTAVYRYLNLSVSDNEEKAHLLSSIAQFLRFPRKLELQDIRLEEQALKGYIETEQELEAVSYDDHQETIDKISGIIAEWFGDFHIDNLRPSHGPGSVAEGPLPLAGKFEVMKLDSKMKILLRNPSFPSSYLEYFPKPPEDGLVRTSRTVFVPKTATKLRTISMEPATLQYIQQGVMFELYRYIDKQPELGRHVRLGDQTQNQVWALMGSKYYTHGTIDLSHASDSVSWDLVRRAFVRVPHLFKWLLGTRSSKTVLPDGREVVLKKFAPMGSALCFPIECILFSAITECALRNVAGPNRNGDIQHFWTVYGDDIVVPRFSYQETVRILEALGFTVNITKSYNSGKYRESCGKEYYAGKDITPLYYRTPFYRKRVSPSAYGSWCNSANNAFLHRLPLYRWYLIQKALHARTRYGPYFTDVVEMAPYIYSPQPTNFHARQRWNSDYQRLEGKFTSVLTRPRGEELDDDSLRYFVELVRMSRRGNIRPSLFDKPPSPYAMQGCVEFFSSTVLPIVPRHVVNPMLAEDWWDT